jgi:hypothetical protein
MKLKEGWMKGFARPNTIINKAKSEGILGIFDKKRNFDDISLEVKLYEQDLFSTPAANRNDSDSRRESA